MLRWIHEIAEFIKYWNQETQLPNSRKQVCGNWNNIKLHEIHEISKVFLDQIDCHEILYNILPFYVYIFVKQSLVQCFKVQKIISIKIFQTQQSKTLPKYSSGVDTLVPTIITTPNHQTINLHIARPQFSGDTRKHPKTSHD